jgi:TetR/AcrR family transcriptional repressor of nem operon
MTPASRRPRTRTAPLRFADWVEAQQRAEPAQRKGERTRARIRLAAIALLNEVGYRDMKVADICERVGITPPVLYLYFANKQALTADVLREFLEEFLTRPEPAVEHAPYASILAANRRWIALARANGGLMRCLLQLSEEVPEFAELFAAANTRWYRHIAERIVQRVPEAAPDALTIQFVAHAMGGMMDELTRKLFTSHDAQLQRLRSQVARSDEQLAHLLSVLWYRALYGRDPEPGMQAPPVAPSLSARSR